MTKTLPRFTVGLAVVALAVFFLVATKKFGLTVSLVAIAAIPVTLWMMVLASKNQVLLVELFCCVAVLSPSLIYWFHLPDPTQYVVDAMALLFLGGVLLNKVRSHSRVRVQVPVLLFVLLLVVLELVNRGFSLKALQSVWPMVLGPLVMTAVINSQIAARDIKPILRVVWGLCVLQLVVVLVQKEVLRIQDVDLIGGTFGRAGTTFISVLMPCFWVAVVALMTSTKRWRLVFWLLVPIVVMAFAEAKAGFVFAAIGTFFVVLVWLSRRDYRNALRTAAIVILPLGAGYLIIRYAPSLFLGSKDAGDFWLRALSDFKGQIAFYTDYSATGQARRLAVLPLAWETLKSQSSVIFGLGFGAMNTSSLFVGDSSAIGAWLANALSWAPSAGRTLLEAGVLGLVGFCLFLSAQVGHGVKLVRHSLSPFQLGLGVSCVGIVPVFLLGGFYTSVWTYRPLAMLFWVFVSLVVLSAQSDPSGTVESPADAGEA